jgi:hypothetical protein
MQSGVENSLAALSTDRPVLLDAAPHDRRRFTAGDCSGGRMCEVQGLFVCVVRTFIVIIREDGHLAAGTRTSP